MTTYEVLTLSGIIIGPLSAVLVTLWSQARNATRDKQLHTFRMLIGTRHLAADPQYSIAINMIPIDFNKHQRIIDAWHRYMDIVCFKPNAENKSRHNEEMVTRQTKLILEISKHLAYNLSESDLEKKSYAAQSFIDRDELSVMAQVAWVRIANALEVQNSAAGLPPPPSATSLVPEQPTNSEQEN